jgi:hypothetical protein
MTYLFSIFYIFEYMSNTKPNIAFLLGVLFLLAWSNTMLAQEVPGPNHVVDTIDTSVDIFDDPNPMEVTLTLDLKKYQKEKFAGEYMPAKFHYRFNDTLTLEKTMRIKARGNFRRQHCSFAPFWLNIRKADVQNQHLQGVKRIKVVTHCKGSKGYGDYVLKEYLAYKIYNLLSPVSFRVRMVKMRYIDTGRKDRVTENWAFMIEPEELLAERLGAIVIKKDDASMRYMIPEEMDAVALFMYMIGNADYSVVKRHNIKLLGFPDFGTKGYTPVPYDFDYSGLVNTYYAIPGENLGISSVTERYFLGACRDDQAYQKAIDHLAEHREEILNLIHEFPHINSKDKNEMIAYLESYFAEAETDYFINMQLKSTCR